MQWWSDGKKKVSALLLLVTNTCIYLGSCYPYITSIKSCHDICMIYVISIYIVVKLFHDLYIIISFPAHEHIGALQARSEQIVPV